MATNYQCNECKKEFSRKSNAFRHKETVHKGISNIINKQTGDVYNKDNYRNTNNSVNNDPFEDYEHVLDFYGRIAVPFEELEKMLAFMPEQTKIKYLADVFATALFQSNPVRALYDTCNFSRSILCKARIIGYMTRSYGTNPLITESLFTNLIKNSPYYKTMLRLKK